MEVRIFECLKLVLGGLPHSWSQESLCRGPSGASRSFRVPLSPGFISRGEAIGDPKSVGSCPV
jgi:hypothetical protein